MKFSRDNCDRSHQRAGIEPDDYRFSLNYRIMSLLNVSIAWTMFKEIASQRSASVGKRSATYNRIAGISCRVLACTLINLPIEDTRTGAMENILCTSFRLEIGLFVETRVPTPDRSIFRTADEWGGGRARLRRVNNRARRIMLFDLVRGSSRRAIIKPRFDSACARARVFFFSIVRQASTLESGGF